MAVARYAEPTDAWRCPHWLPPDETEMPQYAGWYEPADELVVRFRGTDGMRAVVIPVGGQPVDDVNLMVDEDTGTVAGVQVMPLVASAAHRFPTWLACAAERPQAAAVAALVADVHALFDRYGVPPA